MLERYADLRDRLTRKNGALDLSRERDASGTMLFIEMLKIKFLEEAQSRMSKGGKTANQINHIKIIVNVLFGT